MKDKLVSKNEIKQVIEAFKEGKVIALPTETVFGIGVIYDNINAFNNLIIAKNRPLEKAFPLVIGDISWINEFALLNKCQEKIIKTYFPGPLTVVLNKKDNVPYHVTSGKNTIAIRMPDDEFILKVLTNLNKPILLTSANKSGEKPARNHIEALDIFNDSVDMVVIGEAMFNVPSTIVDFTSDEIKLIREGVISFNDIERIYKEDEK
ncbi:TPA: threonylcarbamoyl-AMP synthase [bacterium]|jgi:L-threonylcarbamoyladenylate synthase|nr:threonylcarbamoyl-AMP synthase [bacterium]